MKELIVPDRWNLELERAPLHLGFNPDPLVSSALASASPSSSVEAAEQAVVRAFAGMLSRTSLARLSMLSQRALSRGEPAEHYVPRLVFDLLRSRLHQTIKWERRSGVVALASADPPIQVIDESEIEALLLPREASIAGLEPELDEDEAPSPDVSPCHEFTRTELRSAINFIFLRTSWTITIRPGPSFGLRVRTPNPRAKSYFKGEVGELKAERARAFVARSILRTVNRTTRAEFENAALSCDGDGMPALLQELKDTLRRRYLLRVQSLAMNAFNTDGTVKS